MQPLVAFSTKVVAKVTSNEWLLHAMSACEDGMLQGILKVGIRRDMGKRKVAFLYTRAI